MTGNTPVQSPSSGDILFMQGDDIALQQYVEVNGEPVDFGAYNLVFTVKKTEHADNTLVRQKVTALEPGALAGEVRIRIPAASTALLFPGTYYFSFTAVHLSTGRRFEVGRGTFGIELSTASPNPGLIVPDGELTANGDSVTPTTIITPAESTLPKSPDIGWRF